MDSGVSSEFLAVMCHEIRAPLAGILGFAELLETVGTLGERQARYVAAIKAGGQRVAAMLDAVLDYAHPERGAESLQCREFMPGEAVRQAAADTEGEARDRGMVIEVAEQGPQRAVTADPERFAYAVRCLLGVLVKGAPRDARIALTVKATGDGAEVLMSVQSDAGASTNWEATLAAYEKPGTVLSSNQRSLAFYAAVARRLIEMHGGYVRAGTPDEPGGAFVVWLPDVSQRAAGG